MGKAEFIAVMMSVVSTLMVQSTLGQTVHVVGNSLGWTAPVGNANAYDNWEKTRTFKVGDILTFNFITGTHDVVEVREVSYDACTATNVIGSIIATGPANVTLTTAGEHWYICTFGSGSHCQSGQKLDITVLATAPGTIASPPPPSTNGTTTSPRSATSPPPPAGSSSTAVLSSVFVTFFSIVVCMFL